MAGLKALIIDDEELSRKIILEFLSAHPDIKVCAECPDAVTALEAIERHTPDLLFLDVQMPGVNGFELLEMLEDLPFVIFTTAYDRYALKAFEVNAVDYLLKPFDEERFNTAVDRVRRLIRQQGDESEKIRGLLNRYFPQNAYMDRILVKKSGKIVVLNLDEVEWIEAVGDYVHIHAQHESFLVLKTMRELEGRLDPNRFLRVHRSSIIRLQAVREIVPWTKGRWKIHLKGGHQTLISRSGAQRLKKFML